jgi:putative tricarboxylic transport membrane protein
MKVKSTDFFLGVGAIVLSIGYLYVASGIQESLLSDAVGASGMPKALGWVMAGLGLLLCLRSLSFEKADEKSTAEPASKEAEEAPAGAHPHVQALGLLSILIGYLLVVPYLGYAISVGLLVAAVARYSGAPSNRNMLLISAGAGLGFWLVFSQLLGISMPDSVLWEYL